MNKLLSKALAKTFALHVLATLVIYAVPFRLNFLVFHLVVLVWLLVTSRPSRSPYFYGITVLMSIMALGIFMHQSIFLPIFYLLLLPYWVQAGRYAVRNLYAMPITSMFRLPAMFSRLFNAYKVYHWAASKGSWHRVWVIGWLSFLVIFQVVLVILYNSWEPGNFFDLFLFRLTYWNILSISYTLIPTQVLIQLFIRNASTRFDAYYEVKSQPKNNQKVGILNKLKTNRFIHGLALMLFLGLFLAQLTDLGFMLFWIPVIIFENWITAIIIVGLLIILYLNKPINNKLIDKRPKAKGVIALLVACIMALHFAVPYEHLWLLWNLKQKASPDYIIGYIHSTEDGKFFSSDRSFSHTFISAFGFNRWDGEWQNPSESSLLSSHERLSIKFNTNEYQGIYILEQLIIDGLLEHPQRHEMIEGFSSNDANQDE